jgi:hypothetical protein
MDGPNTALTDEASARDFPYAVGGMLTHYALVGGDGPRCSAG